MPTRCFSMAAISAASCGARMHYPNSSRLAAADCECTLHCIASPALPAILPKATRNEHLVQTPRALQAWADHPAKSPRDGAADAQPGGRRPGAGPAGGRILRAARLRRPFDHRGEPDLAAGPGLSGHARHLFEGTGRRLAQGDGPRARARRTHLHSDLACRPHFAHLTAAERRRAGRALGDPRQGQDLRRRHLYRYLRAARAGAGGNPGDRR